MKDRPATSDTGTMQAEPSGHLLWQSPDKTTRVSFSPEAVEGIRKEVLRGFAAIPKRGAEVGGILLGRRENGRELSIVVEKFHSVDCEYKGGPSYSLSEADRTVLEETLAQHRSKGPNELGVVGFFRSHTRASLFLSSDDQVLFQKFFSDPTNVILLVKPHVSGNCRAALFFWEQDKVPSQSFFPEFPFGPQRAVLAPAEAADPGGIYPPGPPSTAPVYTSAPAGWNNASNRWSPWKFAIALAICLPLAVAAGFLAIKLMETGGPGGRKPAALGLQIEKKGESLLVSWDRGSPVIAVAPRGVLSIRDGPYQQALQLDAGQLRTGTVFYTPSSSDVEFRLDVLQQGNTSVSESLRVLAAAVRSAEVSVPVPVNPPTATPVPVESAPQPEIRRAATPIPIESAPQPEIRRTATPPKVWVAEGVGRGAGERALSPTALAPPPSLDPAQETADSLHTVLAASPAPPPPIVKTPPEPLKTPPEPVKAPPEPVPAPITPPPSGQARIVTAEPRLYIAPKIVKQVSPVLPASAKSLVRSETQIRVKVEIDENGRVSAASAVGSSGPVNAYAREAALKAARLWQFQPAKDTGRSVPSEMTLTFRFVP